MAKKKATKPNDTNIVKVDAKLLRAAYRCVSQEETRSYLCGVRIERHPEGGALLVATDGHRMFIAHDKEGRCRKPIILSLAKEGLKALHHAARSDDNVVFVDQAGIARVGLAYISSKSALNGGTYPDWRRVVPLGKLANAPASFNGGYVGDFGKMSQDLGSPSGSLRIVGGKDEGSPAIILFPDCPCAMGILMPMRAFVPGNRLPKWMQPVLKPARMAARSAARRKKRT